MSFLNMAPCLLRVPRGGSCGRFGSRLLSLVPMVALVVFACSLSGKALGAISSNCAPPLHMSEIDTDDTDHGMPAMQIETQCESQVGEDLRNRGGTVRSTGEDQQFGVSEERTVMTLTETDQVEASQIQVAGIQLIAEEKNAPAPKIRNVVCASNARPIRFSRSKKYPSMTRSRHGSRSNGSNSAMGSSAVANAKAQPSKKKKIFALAAASITGGLGLAAAMIAGGYWYVSHDNDTIDLPVTKPIAEPTTKPIATPTTEPIATPTTEPTTKPIATPTTEPTTKPIATPTTEPTTKPIATPITTPIATPIAKPIAEPTAKPIAEPIATPIAEQVATPIAEQVVDPIAKLIAEAIQQQQLQVIVAEQEATEQQQRQVIVAEQVATEQIATETKSTQALRLQKPAKISPVITATVPTREADIPPRLPPSSPYVASNDTPAPIGKNRKGQAPNSNNSQPGRQSPQTVCAAYDSQLRWLQNACKNNNNNDAIFDSAIKFIEDMWKSLESYDGSDAGVATFMNNNRNKIQKFIDQEKTRLGI
eukprot:GHVT01064883.1.p1 GENE.GHVT01064883.1~~GHVT01064883.1.p1  ORF type:complete len:536 (+),score=29.69 GHVT01064883.1:62-1669(+)